MTCSSRSWLPRRPIASWAVATTVLSLCILPIRAEIDETAPAKTTIWKTADFAPPLDLSSASFDQGRQLYKRVKCSACHRMNGNGNEFGPDLAQLDSKWDELRILRHVLEPSVEINKDFQSHEFELSDGRTVSGLITAAGPRFIKVVQNPLQSSQSTRVMLDSIRSRRKSRISFMPAGLLNTLSREEVICLIAYVNSRGNDRHPSYGEADQSTAE